MTTRAISEILPVIGATVRDVDNWLARVELSTRFQETRRGSARVFTLRNTLELAFIAALVRGGATPKGAAAYAAMFLRQMGRDELKEWFVFAAGNLKRARPSDPHPDLSSLQKEFGSATTLSFVPTGEIARKVDALYREAPDE